MATMTAQSLESLQDALRGPVFDPQSADYDEARTIYNAMIDRRPAAIARCADVADVIAAIKFADGQGLDVAVVG